MSTLSKRARDVAANLRGKLKLGEEDISSDSVVMIATLLESCGEEIEMLTPKKEKRGLTQIIPLAGTG